MDAATVENGCDRQSRNVTSHQSVTGERYAKFFLADPVCADRAWLFWRCNCRQSGAERELIPSRRRHLGMEGRPRQLVRAKTSRPNVRRRRQKNDLEISENRIPIRVS